jgi:hypothetical protein
MEGRAIRDRLKTFLGRCHFSPGFLAPLIRSVAAGN